MLYDPLTNSWMTENLHGQRKAQFLPSTCIIKLIAQSKMNDSPCSIIYIYSADVPTETASRHVSATVAQMLLCGVSQVVRTSHLFSNYRCILSPPGRPQVQGRILVPSSCATLMDSSPWSCFVSHVTSCAAAAVTCPPIKPTGQISHTHVHITQGHGKEGLSEG